MTSDLVAIVAQRAEESFAELYSAIDGDDRLAAVLAGEGVQAAIKGVALHRHIVVTLSSGPGHRLDVELDSNGDVTAVLSVASWSWSNDPFRTAVHRGSALWRLAESVARSGLIP